MAGYVVVNWRLNLAGRGLLSLDTSALEKCCRVAEHVDLSRNQLSSLECLEGFDRMQTLTCDHNAISSLSTLPVLKHLDTLSLNFNLIRNLECLEDLARSCPSLAHLSLMGNPCCPLFGPTACEDTYAAYREEVTYYVPGLLFLDGSLLKKDSKRTITLESKRRVSSLAECEIGEWPKA